MISPTQVFLMREQSQPAVYFVYGGARFGIPNPNELSALGFDASKVQVVPDGTLASVPAKPLYTSNVKPSDIFWDFCTNPLVGIILPSYDPLMSKDPHAAIRKNILVAGWLARDLEFSCWKTEQTQVPIVTEDFHYDVILDADFMMQMYGNGGLSSALNGAVLSGNLSQPGIIGMAGDPPFNGPNLRFDDVDPQTGSSRGVTMNSFALPHMGGALVDGCHPAPHLSNSSSTGTIGSNPLSPSIPPPPLGYSDCQPGDFLQTGPVFVHGELNCWHVNDGPLFQRWYKGRGNPPAGWMQLAFCNDPNNDAWWPFNPYNPDGGPRNLQKGDYVLMKGTLWQEHAHDLSTPSLWRTTPALLGHVGLIEMHPPDIIIRVQPPPLPRTAYMVACNTYGTDWSYSVIFLPLLEKAPSPWEVLRSQELIDGRYSNMSTVTSHSSEVSWTGNQVSVYVQLHPDANTHYANFKAVYLSWWQVLQSVWQNSAGLVVGQNSDGCLEAFYINTDTNVFHNRQTAPNGGWSGWNLLGPTAQAASSLLVAQNANGTLEVFALGTDSNIYHNYQTAPNDGWSSWSQLPGGWQGKALAVGCNADGRLELFVIGTDNNIWHNWQTGPNTDIWSGWNLLGPTAQAASSLLVAQNANGTLEVFALGTDSNIYHSWQTVPNGWWSSWSQVPGGGQGKLLSAGRNTDGRLELFVVGMDNNVWHNWQTSPNSDTWSGWNALPLGSLSPVATLSPRTINFGSVYTDNTSSAETVTVTNAGSAPLTITGISLSGANPGDFNQTNNCAGASLAPGTSCTISATFSPLGVGPRQAVLTVTDNASGSPQQVVLQGQGVKPRWQP